MKTLMLCILLSMALSASAQVEIDKPVELTGGTGERYITNLELPVNGVDAASKDYVDTAVSAGGGGGMPTMISTESATSMNYGDALRYCKNLNQSGHSDWHLPTREELFRVVSTGGTSVPNDASSNFIWLTDWLMIGSNSAGYNGIRLSDGTYTSGYPYSTYSLFVRCVR